MSLTIILSGPKSSASQARNALVASGLDVQGTEHDHGLPATASGKTLRQAQAFITVHGDDINAAADAAASLGWVLRMHFETPELAPPSTEQLLVARLDDMERQIAEMRAGNAA